MTLRVASRPSPVTSHTSLLDAYFSTTLQSCIFPELLTGNSQTAPPFAVALSGGADSLALTLLANDWANAHGASITTLTVDHRLRADSTAEANHVADIMRAFGIAHTILTPEPLPAIRNPQAQARARRYDAMLSHCQSAGITHLLLGHHADDQAETVALQRHRGNNPASRAGMALVSERAQVTLVRPLLGVRKNTLVAYLRARSVAWVEDPTNASDRYARNRLRQHLSEAEIIALWHEAQTQGALRHASDVARNAWLSAHATITHGTATLALDAWRQLMPHETQTDYLSHAIRVIGGKTYRPRLAETERLAQRIMGEAVGRATLGHCVVEWHRAALRIAPEPKHAATLDAPHHAPHMERDQSHNPLVAPPFWWFNIPLHTALE